MKKTLLFAFSAFLLMSSSSYGQVLDQTATWPSTSWSLHGVWDAAALLSDPTGADGSFSLDDDVVGSGVKDSLWLESPVIDLTAALAAGEDSIAIDFTYNFNEIGGDYLGVEYWDADNSLWVSIDTLLETTTATAQAFADCGHVDALSFTTTAFKITTWTPTQLSGFKYRFMYDDKDGWKWGYCIGAPRIYSFNFFANLAEQAINNASIYPNPTSSKVTVDFGDFNGTLSYTLSSIEGKVVENGTNNSSSLVLDLSDKKEGVYLLTINDDLNIKTYQIVKE